MNSIVHKIFELKANKKYEDMAFVKNNKKFIGKLLKSKTKLKVIESSPHEYVQVNNKWYDFNHQTYHYQQINFS